MCECGEHSLGPSSVAQSLDELEFERGLWHAAQYGDADRALHLLDKGFPVDKRDSAGYTALHYAARNGHRAVCQLLLDRGARVDAATAQGRATALHRAAAAGGLEVVKLLAERADRRLKDGDGRTALHRAAIGRHADICRLLLQLEPSLKGEVDKHGKTAGDYAGDFLKELLT